MRKARDHKAEYARRRASGAARGLTPSQSRGHARAGESPLRGAPLPVFDRRFEFGLKALRGGESLRAAAKAISVSTERLSRYAKHHAGARFKGRMWELDDQRIREVLTFTRGEAKVVRVRGFEEASRAGRYWDGAHIALAEPDLFPAFAENWRDTFLIDAYGKRHWLVDDASEIYRLAHLYDDQRFEDIYNIVV